MSIESIKLSGWTFAQIHIDVITNKQLTDRAKTLYAYLAYMAGPGGQCWPSIGTIAEDMGWSERKVSYALSDLEKVGLLETQQRPGTSAKRTLNATPARPCEETIGIKEDTDSSSLRSEESEGEPSQSDTPLTTRIRAVEEKIAQVGNKQGLLARWTEHLSGEYIHPAAIAKLVCRLYEQWDGYERPDKTEIYHKLVRWAVSVANESPPEGKFFSYLHRYAEEQAGISYVPAEDRERHKELQRLADAGLLEIKAPPGIIPTAELERMQGLPPQPRKEIVKPVILSIEELKARVQERIAELG